VVEDRGISWTWGVWDGLVMGMERMEGRGRARSGGIGICVGVPTRGWAVFSCVCSVLHLFFICSLRISPVSNLLLLFFTDALVCICWVPGFFATYCFGPPICMLVFLLCFYCYCAPHVRLQIMRVVLLLSPKKILVPTIIAPFSCHSFQPPPSWPPCNIKFQNLWGSNAMWGGAP